MTKSGFISVKTLSSEETGFRLELNGQVVLQFAKLPERITLRLRDGSFYSIVRGPADFLSKRSYYLSNSAGVSIASLVRAIKVSDLSLFWGGDIFNVSSQSRLPLGESLLRVAPLSIDCIVIERLLSVEIATLIDTPDDDKLALIVFLHFLRVWIWRES